MHPVWLPFLASLVGHLKLGNWATKRQREREGEEPTGGRADSERHKILWKFILDLYKPMAKTVRVSGFKFLLNILVCLYISSRREV